MNPFRFDQYIDSKHFPQCVWLQPNTCDDEPDKGLFFGYTNVYWVSIEGGKPTDVVVEIVDCRDEGIDYYVPTEAELAEVKRLTQDYLDSNRVEQQP
jgi:hypothetical protein